MQGEEALTVILARARIMQQTLQQKYEEKSCAKTQHSREREGKGGGKNRPAFRNPTPELFFLP